MKKAFRILTCLSLLAALAACSKGSGSTSTEPEAAEVSAFIGLWRMSLKADASDPGLDWRFNADNTISLYDTGSTRVKGTGTCAISDQTATGTWQVDNVNKGTFTSTLTGEDSLDFDFIETKYTPAKTLAYTGARLEGPPSGTTTATTTSSTTSSETGEDELDPSLVSWDSPAGDVGAWEITSTILSADITAERIRIVRSPSDNWPPNSSSKPSVGNWWIIGYLKSDGRWHAATIDWLGVGRTEMKTPKWDGNGDLNSELEDWRPVSGETAYLMQSTHARAGIEIAGNKQRTNIVKVTMP